MLKRLFAVLVLMLAILFTPYFGFTHHISEFLTSVYMGDMNHARAMLTGEEDDSRFAPHGVVLKDRPSKTPEMQPQTAGDKTTALKK